MPYKDYEDSKAHEKFRLAKRKMRFIEEAGGRCIDCGFSAVPEVLQFHHRDGEEKVFDVGVGQGEAKIRAEVGRCDLVCPTCHAVRHLVEEEWRGQRARFLRYPKGSKSAYSLTRNRRKSDHGVKPPGGP